MEDSNGHVMSHSMSRSLSLCSGHSLSPSDMRNNTLLHNRQPFNHKTLSFGRRVQAAFQAPIVKFWINTVNKDTYNLIEWCDVMDYLWRDVMMWYDVIMVMWLWCDMMWCDMMWCDVMWYDVMWCDVMWCDVMWYDVMWCELHVKCCHVVWCDGSDATWKWCGVKRCELVMKYCDLMWYDVIDYTKRVTM